MRLGIDLDGVVLDNDASWARYYDAHARRHDHPSLCLDHPPHWDYYQELCPHCFDGCCHDAVLLQASPLMPGADIAIPALAQAHELFVISARGEDLRAAIVLYLDRARLTPSFAGIQLGHTPKYVSCQLWGIDLLLDDNPLTAAEFATRQAVDRFVVFDQPYNRHVALPRVQSWLEFVHFLAGAPARVA